MTQFLQDLRYGARMLAMRLAMPDAKYGQSNQAAAFCDQLLQRLAALPEVQAAASAGEPGTAEVGGPQSPWFLVVGVVGDVKDCFSGQPQPAIYLSHLQRPQHSMKPLIRTAGDPLRLVTGARAQVRSLDPDQPVYDVESMEQYLAGQTSGVRISATMIAVFAAMALVLAAAGIYAVISYSAAQRTREIGVRMALGATRGDVLKLVVGHALKFALAGLALGLPAAYALTRAMSSALFGVIALDLATFAGFTGLLAATALLAGYIPARRATRVDPIVALRYE